MYGLPYAVGPSAGWVVTPFPDLPQVIHCFERYTEPTAERVVYYNDNTGPSGTGYIFAKIYDIQDNEVPGSPFEVSTIMSANCSFGGDYLPSSPQCLQIVFTLATTGIPTRFQSSDYGRTWLQLT